MTVDLTAIRTRSTAADPCRPKSMEGTLSIRFQEQDQAEVTARFTTPGSAAFSFCGRLARPRPGDVIGEQTAAWGSVG